jgi:hypothetical protein
MARCAVDYLRRHHLALLALVLGEEDDLRRELVSR